MDKYEETKDMIIQSFERFGLSCDQATKALEAINDAIVDLIVEQALKFALGELRILKPVKREFLYRQKRRLSPHRRRGVFA